MNASATEFKTGVLKWFDFKKGFGFIVPEPKGPDVFVHRALFIERKIWPEPFKQLEYQDIRTGAGMRAIDIRETEGEAVH